MTTSKYYKDTVDTHTFWVADILVVSTDTGYNTNRVDLCRLPSLSSHIPLTVFNTPVRLYLTSDLFLKGASISDVSKKIAPTLDESPSRQQKESFLRQQLAAFSAN